VSVISHRRRKLCVCARKRKERERGLLLRLAGRRCQDCGKALGMKHQGLSRQVGISGHRLSLVRGYALIPAGATLLSSLA
jgi:hypothetical protein